MGNSKQRGEMKNPRILIIKYRPIGDSIIGLSSIQYLHNLFPNAQITFAVRKEILPVFDMSINENVNYKSISFNVSDWISTYKEIKKDKYDFIIELQQTGRSRNFFKLFSVFSFTKYYFHNHSYPGEKKILDQGIKKPVIQRDLDGVWSALSYHFKDFKSIAPDYLDYEPFLKLNKCKTKDERSVILGISAGRKEKIWDTNNYRKLITELNKVFPDLKFVIPLSDNHFDKIIEKDMILWNSVNRTVIKKSIGELPYEISGSGYYIGNDTGLKHLSVSLGLKTLTIFGPEDPVQWHPYNTEKHTYVFNKNINDIAFEEVLHKSINLISS